MATEHGYGFFPGGDPRRFDPDPEASTEAERENHRLASEAWERGERTSEPDCLHGDGVIVTRCQFGLGSYTYDAPDESERPWYLPSIIRFDRTPRRIKKMLRRYGLVPVRNSLGWTLWQEPAPTKAP